MKNIKPHLLTLSLLLVLSSFTNNVPSIDVAGTYGVSVSDPAQVKLVLCEDSRFYFHDFSNSKRPIVASGLWKQKGRHVALEHHNLDISFHDKWVIEADGKAARSRKGLSFYRLCRK